MEDNYSFISWDLQGETHPDPPTQRGTTSRRTLPCGCVVVTYSSPNVPFGRSATEKYCQIHNKGRLK